MKIKQMILLPVALALTVLTALAYDTHQDSHTVPGFPNLWTTGWVNDASDDIDNSAAGSTEKSEAHDVLEQIATWIETNKDFELVPGYQEFGYGGASGWASIDYYSGAYYISFEIYW